MSPRLPSVPVWNIQCRCSRFSRTRSHGNAGVAGKINLLLANGPRGNRMALATPLKLSRHVAAVARARVSDALWRKRGALHRWEEA